jgi:hypothetical protein
MNADVWRQLLRTDPHAYRARVLFFARTDWHALREHRVSLSLEEFLLHLEALFQPEGLGPGDRFEMSLWWGEEQPHYTVHVRGQDGMRRPESLGNVGATHRRAVARWVKDTTRRRRMAPWQVHVGAPPPYRPPQELLDACLAEFPDARLISLSVQRFEGIHAPGFTVEPGARIEASLEALDGGTVQVFLGEWTEEDCARLEEWAQVARSGYAQGA